MSENRFPKEAISNPKFIHAMRERKKHRLWFNLPSTYQIKIGKFNFFWSTGKITVDGYGKITQRDIESFIALVQTKEQPSGTADSGEQAKRPTPPKSDSAFATLAEDASATPPWE